MLSLNKVCSLSLSPHGVPVYAQKCPLHAMIYFTHSFRKMTQIFIFPGRLWTPPYDCFCRQFTIIWHLWHLTSPSAKFSLMILWYSLLQRKIPFLDAGTPNFSNFVHGFSDKVSYISLQALFVADWSFMSILVQFWALVSTNYVYFT